MPKQVTNVAADDALTTIYRLSHDEQEEVIAARVAERLDIKPASAAGMLTRLRRDKLVRIDGRKRIALSGTASRGRSRWCGGTGWPSACWWIRSASSGGAPTRKRT